MRPRYISLFWVGYCLGLVCLSPAWAERDQEPPAPEGAELSMEQWLRLPEARRAALVEAYARRRPNVRYVTTAERRQQEAA